MDGGGFVRELGDLKLSFLQRRGPQSAAMVDKAVLLAQLGFLQRVLFLVGNINRVTSTKERVIHWCASLSVSLILLFPSFLIVHFLATLSWRTSS